MPEKRKRAVIAGGGTGGHIYAGLSIAEEMRSRWKDAEILYVGAKRGLEAKILPEAKIDYRLIESLGIKGKGAGEMIKGMLAVPQSIIQSMGILRSFNPNVAVGVGGYSSGPVIFSAWLRGVPSLILEQNLYPGTTNRILSRFAKKVAVNFKGSADFFQAKKVFWSGNPVRENLSSGSRERACGRWGISQGVFTLFVFGGSQGSVKINSLMSEAALILKERGVEFQIIHQTGERDFPKIDEIYRNNGIKGVAAPFINEMNDAYRAADLVLSRAGATTLSELSVCGKASILIPFPYATNNHQEHNARNMEELGAAIMIRESEATSAMLADKIESLAKDRIKLKSFSENAAKMRKTDGAKEIVNLCEEIMAER